MKYLGNISHQTYIWVKYEPDSEFELWIYFRIGEIKPYCPGNRCKKKIYATIRGCLVSGLKQINHTADNILSILFFFFSVSTQCSVILTINLIENQFSLLDGFRRVRDRRQSVQNPLPFNPINGICYLLRLETCNINK